MWSRYPDGGNLESAPQRAQGATAPSAARTALNPEPAPGNLNIADRLLGKKVLVGGVEGLTRGLRHHMT
jgi:hypothetical protein